MKRNFQKLLFGAIAVLSLFIFSDPMLAKAYDNTMYVIDATDTTLTVDWSDALKDLVEDDKKTLGYTITKFEDFKLRYKECPTNINDVHKQPAKSISTKLRQYTITGLKPNTSYVVSVSYSYKFNSSGGGGGSGSHNFQTNMATTASEPKKAELMGVTGTTATVDFRSVLRDITTDLLANNYSSPYGFETFVGYADQADGKEAAVKSARSIAGRQVENISRDQGTYTMRGLTPDHSYSFCAAVSYYAHDENDKSIYFFRYIELSDITPTGADDSDIYKRVAPDNRYERTRDAESVGAESVSSTSEFGFETTVTEDSITIDWSKRSKSDQSVVAAKGESKIYLACVEETQYDVIADRIKYGSGYNYGPNVREAKKKTDARGIGVAVSTKSYTFKNLKPGTKYTIMMKCGFKRPNQIWPTMYPFRKHIGTTGTVSDSEYEYYFSNQKQDAYMYDVTMAREGSDVVLDWTNTLTQYCAQPILAKHFTQLFKNGYRRTTTLIGYEKLPDTYTKEDVERAYKKAVANAKNSNYTAIGIDYPYTNARLYGLDPNAKYVFAIVTPLAWYYYGETKNYTPTFYADDNGMNYYKAKATGVTYGSGSNPGSGSSDDPGSGSSGSGESGSGSSGSGSGESGSGSSGPGSGESGSGSSGPGSGESGSGSSGSESGSTGSGTGNSSNAGTGSGFWPWNTQQTQAPTNPQPSAGTVDSKWIALNKLKKNEAHVYCDSNKLSASKLKSKAQKVTLKVDNSKGKIKISEVGNGKGKKYAKIKVKGRQVVITFKKGTQKGTYRFKLTVEGSGKVKKTKETIKIKVK